MIILDTHIWIWWVHDDDRLSSSMRKLISENESNGIGVSIISCWEVAKLVEKGRLELPVVTSDWINQALSYPGIRLIELIPEICVKSTEMPGEFHKDPADQIITATSMYYNWLLLTCDNKILQYQHVETFGL